MMIVKTLIIILLSTSLYAQKPELLLLNNYTKDKNISSWYMSEKLDGVRAYWDGEKLLSRSGRVFMTPSFFTKDFPKIKLDGELWIERGVFEKVVSVVNKQEPHDGWREITYNIFEVPEAEGNLTQRLSLLQETKFIKIIKQIQIKNQEDLNDFLQTIEAKGGEGVVVRDGSLEYYTGRTNSALKVKSYIDAECEVMSHIKGEGKYKNMLGSFVCKMQNNKLIKIGSGLNDNQRKTFFPKIGAIITFKYYGLTSLGNPRFPVYMRTKN